MIRSACLACMVALVLGACSGEGGDASGASMGATGGPPRAERGVDGPGTLPPGFNALPQGPWTTLADRLVQARDLPAAVAATREALARGGVGTWDGSAMLVAPVGTPATFVDTPMETVHLAMEARHKATMGRMDAAEFAQMLETFGWPFEEADPRARADQPIVLEVAEEVRDAWHEEIAAANDAVREAAQADRDARRAATEAERKALLGPLQARREAIRAEQQAANALLRETPRDQRDAVLERVHAANEAARALAREYDAAYARWRELSEARRVRDEAAAEGDRMAREVARLVGPDHAAGERLMGFLADWVNDAIAHPEDPRSFTPLFLAEMARRQNLPVDLSGGHRVSPLEAYERQPPATDGPRSARLRWTLLEMQLFVAAFHRHQTKAVSRVPGDGVAERLGNLLVPAAHAATPCSDLKDAAGGGWGEAQTIAASEASGFLTDAVFGKYFGDAGGAALGNAMSATNSVGKIIKLAAFYLHENVTVEADPTLVHKPLGAYKRATFIARAGVDPKDLEAYRELSDKMSGADQALRDCLGWAGFPSTSTIAEVAKDAENWRIDWRMLGGYSPHAVWAPGDSDMLFSGGRQTTAMKRVSPSTAESKFVLRVLPESRDTGRLSKAQVWVRASVDASGGPPFGALVSAAKGVFGLVDGLTEIATGWFLVAFKPKAYAVVDIEYHCPNPTTIHRYVKDPVADGIGQPGAACTFVFDSKEEFEAWRDAGG